MSNHTDRTIAQENEINNQPIILANSYCQNSSPLSQKSISFDGKVPPIVDPTEKRQIYSRRQSVVTKDFTGWFLVSCLHRKRNNMKYCFFP